MKYVCVKEPGSVITGLQELEIASCGEGIVLLAVPFLRTRRTEGVCLVLEDLLVHAHYGTFLRAGLTVALPS
jgi:hypothetical protein